MADFFSHNILIFARLLRSLGLDVSPEQVSDLTRITALVGVAHRSDFYYSARALFVRRRADLPLFDRAFEFFFNIRGKPQQSVINPTKTPARRIFQPRRLRQVGERETPHAGREKKPDPQDATDEDRVLTYTPIEILRRKNFDQFTTQEIQDARRLIASLDWQVGERRTRRKSSALHGAQIDLPRVIRRNLKYGTELFQLPEREPKYKVRPLVVLADISGSMERYSRMVLHLLHALSQEMTRVEVFTFGTRLTRITPDLKKKSVDAALARAARRVPDWSGGTRIGEALKTFNFKWARRVLRAGAVVLIISDGWDRGDLHLLRQEMARLQRSCHRLIWLNPLLGAPAFEPSAGGMQVALPFVDDFLPVHNVVSLESLIAKLGSLRDAKPARRQRPRAVIPIAETPGPRKSMELPQMGKSDYVRRTMRLRMVDDVPTVLYEDNPDES